MLWNEAIGIASKGAESHGIIDSTKSARCAVRMSTNMRMRKLIRQDAESHISAYAVCLLP